MKHQFFIGLIIGIVVGSFSVYLWSILRISKKRIPLPAIKPGTALARVIDGGRDEQSSL